MKRPKLLLVEDDRFIVDSLRVPIENIGYEFGFATDGDAALASWIRERPDVVVLDIELKGTISGLQVLAAVRKIPHIAKTPVIMLTASGDMREPSYQLDAQDYFVKPVRLRELKARLQVLLRQIRQSPEAPTAVECRLLVRSGHPVTVSVEGRQSVDTSTLHPLKLDVGVLGLRAESSLTSPSWRSLVADDGRRLFESLFDDTVLGAYKFALGLAGPEEILLRIETTPDQYSVPFEFLHDANANMGEQYLSLLHPFCRSLLGVRRVAPVLNPAQFTQRDKPLKVLVTASDTSPSIPGAEREAQWVAERIAELFRPHGIGIDLTYLPTETATVAEVTRRLTSEHYDLWHYAGHGFFDSLMPERSGLPFWTGLSKEGPMELITATKLNRLLNKAGVRAVYLSCCYSSAAGQSHQADSNAFLGLSEAIVRAGVPSVFGFRTAVSDDGALAMCADFYKYLAEYGDMPRAVLECRQEAFARAPNDRSWISAVLTSQR